MSRKNRSNHRGVVSAKPPTIKVYGYQKAILAALSDPDIKQIVVVPNRWNSTVYEIQNDTARGWTEDKYPRHEVKIPPGTSLHFHEVPPPSPGYQEFLDAMQRQAEKALGLHYKLEEVKP